MFLCLLQCRVPVIAAIHSACVGGGVDLTTACDIRFCSQDAYFQVKVRDSDTVLSIELATN